MDPATLAIVATVGSTAMGAVGAIQQSKAASAAAGYNAKVAAQNAEVATQNANYAGAQGNQNVAAAQAETRAKVAAIEANQGASGVDINSGSAVDVRQSEAKLGMLNALNSRSKAVRDAYGFQTQSTNYTAQSKLDKSQAKSAKTAGYLNAATTVLGGAGKAADYYGAHLTKTDPVGLTGDYGPYDNSLPWRNTPMGA